MVNAQHAGTSRVPVAGIGASAGGIEALQNFFAAIPGDLGVAYVVVVHLAPDHKSGLPEILGRHTAMPVTQIGNNDTVALARDSVYVIAPGCKLEITNTSVGAAPYDEPRGQRSAIDLLFRSLAASYGDGFAIVLSGSGADGAVGAKAIKEAGGLVLVQDPREATHDGMPRAVLSTGCADVVLPVHELAARLVALVRDKERVARLIGLAEPEPRIHEDDETILRRIFELLRSRTGHDFSKYKRNTVLRRLARRMQLSHQPGFADHLRYLRENPEETLALFDDLLITVTTFFRDPEAWAALQERVIGPLVEHADPAEPIRCWVPGCATGEEAYTLAILFQEEIEHRKLQREVTIFASDVDEGALATAREGLFPSAISTDVSEARLERFFHAQGNHYRVASGVRERIVFASHSVLHDPPFSRLRLLSCRNLLIYLDHDLQDQVMRVFQYACRDDGYLFLGASESADPDLFRPIDKKHRIFGMRPSADAARPVPPEMFEAPRARAKPGPAPRAAAGQQAAEIHLEALEKLAPPSLVIDEHWNVLHLSGTAARFLQQRGGMLARAVTELVRPELRDELHAVLHRALEEPGQQLSRFVPVSFNGSPHDVGLLAQWRRHSDGVRAYALVTFLEAGLATGEAPPAEQEPTKELVRTLRERLHQAELRIERMRDDHQLANEDLRAANEELQSINEEYRSTTEELETAKEELQSSNEELQTVNNELNSKLDEVSRAHNDLENLMAATDIATLFLDKEHRINRFTPQLTGIFNVTPRDVGRPIGDFTHSLDYETLEADASSVLADLTPRKREARSRDGRAFIVRLRPYRTAEDEIEGVVVTLIDVTDLKHAEQVLSESEERFRALVEASAQMVWTTDAAGRVVEDSPTWCAYTGQTPEQRKDRGWLDVVHPEDRAMAEAAWRQAVETVTPLTSEFRIYYEPTGQYRWSNVRAVPLKTRDETVRGWVGMNIDVNERREAVEALRQADVYKDEFLAMLGHELRNPLAAIRNSLEVLGVVGVEHESAAGSAWGIIDRQSRHIHRLLNDLLDVTRIKRGKLRLNREPVDLGECVHDAVAALRTELDAKPLELELDLPENPIHLEADAERLVQILDNLLRNSITYTEAGGRIELRARCDAERARVTVRDTGIGIAADEAEALFEPYYQTGRGRHSSGLGLGLTLVKRLVEMHGGTISAHSEGRGAGAEFVLSLPLSRSAPARSASAAPMPAAHRVLVVDDQADIADTFTAMLESLGQQVCVAYSGEAAIAIAREHEPRVAFLDLSMPDMDGREVARRLRAEFPAEELILVALSGYGKKHATAQSPEFEHHLLKPADVGAVIELLNTVVDA